MEELDFDQVTRDKMGNVIGRISGGWNLSWMRYRREGEEGQNAYILAGLMKIYLRNILKQRILQRN